jgi:hypothetical protein
VRRSTTWLVAGSVAGLMALLLACILVFPRLLYPPLSEEDLAGVTHADRRVELRQAQSQGERPAGGAAAEEPAEPIGAAEPD